MFWAFGQLNFDVRYICLIFWPAQNAKFSAAFIYSQNFRETTISYFCWKPYFVRTFTYAWCRPTRLWTLFYICLIQTNSSLNVIVQMPDADQLVFERYCTNAWCRPTRLWTLFYICLIQTNSSLNVIVHMPDWTNTTLTAQYCTWSTAVLTNLNP